MAGEEGSGADQKGFSFVDSPPSSPYMVNSKIMIAAIVVLFLVVVFILILHIYAKWFWRNSYVISGRRRRRLDFAASEGYQNLANVGLEKSVIDSLPTFVYKLPESEESAALECAVCLCEFQENEKGRLLPKCNHSFHIDCIDMWFHSHSSCPLCRTSAQPDTIPEMGLNHQVHIISTHDASLPHLQNPEISLQPESPEIDPVPSEAAELDLTRAASERFQICLKQGGRSMPHIAIDIPKRSESFLGIRSSSSSANTPRRGQSASSPQCSSIEELSCSLDGQTLKSPTARLKSLKRLLSRDRKVFTTERPGDFQQGESVSNA